MLINVKAQPLPIFYDHCQYHRSISDHYHYGTDRNNIVEMEGPPLNYSLTSEKQSKMFPNAEIVWSSDPATKTVQDLTISMASSGYYSGMALCQASPAKIALNAQLNNASPSYRGMLLKFKAGTYYYTCAPETTTSLIAVKREDFSSKPKVQPAVNAS